MSSVFLLPMWSVHTPCFPAHSANHLALRMPPTYLPEPQAQVDSYILSVPLKERAGGGAFRGVRHARPAPLENDGARSC
jgi:hypothetical protein